MKFRRYSNTSIIDQIVLFLFSMLVCSSIKCEVKGFNSNNCSTASTLEVNDEHNAHKENSKISSLIAKTAALKAKEASDAQEAAGAEAALEVKEKLAERAKDAARMAQAALAGKQGIVDELQKTILLTEGLIEEGTPARQSILQDVKSIMGVDQQIENMIKQLQNLIQIATQAQNNDQNAGCILQKEADSKTTRLEMNCQRFTKLMEKLKTARADLEETMKLIKCNWH